MKMLKELLGVFRSRLGIKLVAPLLIAVAAMLTPVFIYFQYEKSIDLSSQQAIVGSENAVQNITVMEASIRQEMLDVHEVLMNHYQGKAADSRFVSDFNTANGQIDSAHASAERFANNKLEQDQLAECNTYHNQFADIFRNQILPVTGRPNVDLGPPEDRLEAIYGNLIRLSSSLGASFNVDRNTVIEQQASQRETIENWGLAGAACGVFLGLLASGLLTRRLLMPVKDMVTGAEKISRGDLAHRIPARSGRDEIARLSVSFNEMAESLERQMQQQEQEKARIRSVHQSIGDGIIVVDRSGVIISANPAAEATLGKSALELERSSETGVPLLQQAIKRSIRPEDMVECWEAKGCSKTDCPSFRSEDLRCWLQCGTHCNNQIQGTFRQKRDACERCGVFQNNAVQDLEVEINDRHYSVEIVPILDDEGQEGGRTVVMHDVTDLLNAKQEMESKSAELELLNQVGEAVSSSLDLDKMLGMVLEKVLDAWHLDTGGVHVLDRATGQLKLLAWANISEEARRSLESAPAGKGVAWRVVKSGEVEIIDDSAQEPDMVPAIVKSGIRSVMGAPLTVSDKVVGSLVLASSRPALFSRKDARLLKLIGNQIGVAVENSILYQSSVEHARKALAKSRIITALSSSLELDQVWDDFMQETKKLVDFDRISVTIDAGNGQVKLLAQTGNSPSTWETGQTFSASDSLPGMVILSGKPYLSGDIEVTAKFDRQRQMVDAGYHSQLIMPLFAKGEVIGSLNLSSRKRNAFSKNDLDELNPIAGHVALSIFNQRLFEDISRGKAEWEATFDSVADGIAIIGMDYRIIRMNHAAAQMLGGSVGDFIRGECFRTIDPNCNPEKCALIGGSGPTRIEREMEDGRSLELTLAPVNDSDGNLIGAVHVLRDVTEARRMRQQLVQSEKMVAVGQLVSGVAHEINNPLTGVIGYSQLLLTQDIGEKAKKDAEAIYSEAQRATKIVRHLLSFARKHAPEQSAVDINALITESVNLKAYDLRVNNITVDTHLDEGIPATMADPHQLQQVFLNLITNAEQAMLDSRGSGRLVITASRTDDKIRIGFTDNGPGVPPEIRDRIFDPFFTTKDIGKGTGLGLSICYGILQEHHGSIWLERSEGPGASIVIELPVVEVAGQAKVEKPAAAAAVSTRLGKVLLVDDEASIREVLTEAMRKMGHSVDTARNGSVALRMLKAKRYDCVVSDVRMPEMDGPSLLTAIRQADPELARRFIFISGDSVNPATQTYLSRLGNPFLVKPFDPSELGSILQDILAGGERRKAS